MVRTRSADAPWLWIGLPTVFFSVLHIILDFGVGLFDLHGTLSPPEATTLVGITLVQLWWAVSFRAAASAPSLTGADLMATGSVVAGRSQRRPAARRDPRPRRDGRG